MNVHVFAIRAREPGARIGRAPPIVSHEGGCSLPLPPFDRTIRSVRLVECQAGDTVVEPVSIAYATTAAGGHQSIELALPESDPFTWGRYATSIHRSSVRAELARSIGGALRPQSIKSASRRPRSMRWCPWIPYRANVLLASGGELDLLAIADESDHRLGHLLSGGVA
jgi:hypothetical protein